MMVIRIVALHEAAHCVLAVRRGFRIVRSTIRPENDALGRTELDRAPDPRTRAGLAVLLAGDAAVDLARTGSRLPEGPVGPWARLVSSMDTSLIGPSSTDHEAIASAGLSEARIEAARREVLLELIHGWNAVRAVADLLLEHGSVRGWTIDRAIGNGRSGGENPQGPRRLIVPHLTPDRPPLATHAAWFVRVSALN